MHIALRLPRPFLSLVLFPLSVFDCVVILRSLSITIALPAYTHLIDFFIKFTFHELNDLSLLTIDLCVGELLLMAVFSCYTCSILDKCIIVIANASLVPVYVIAARAVPVCAAENVPGGSFWNFILI